MAVEATGAIVILEKVDQRIGVFLFFAVVIMVSWPWGQGSDRACRLLRQLSRSWRS